MVDAVLRVVLQNINSLLQEEFALAWGVDREMERFSSVLSTIRDVLEDAEMKQFKDKAIKSWLKKLKDAAYDADDILDEYAAKALQLQEAQTRNCGKYCTNQVTHSFLSWFNFEQLMFRHKIGHRIKEITERFDDIADERSKFHLNPKGIVVEWNVDERSERETSSILTTEHPVYGREEDKEVIVKVLLENVSNPNLLVYPIIGMGGLGKTTLAQLVFNDERVKNHFEARNWVCVSDDFDVKRLTKAIIESMGGTAYDLTELDPMQSRLHEMLSRKRYLVVLDDVWNEEVDKWERVKSSLTCGIEGCAILVTTRIEKVASIMGTFPAHHHHLKGLSEDNCWALFKQRAFGGNRSRDENGANLEVIGKEIVKKCGGLPLAAKALGGLLRFKHTETEWLFVRDNEIWDLPENEENSILPALRLSYNHLPSHLRQCFAYCSIFPKDCRIEKERLVQLWMANGFIPKSKGKMELEDIGNEIFNELLWRSFFQDIEKDGDGNVILFCKMHDLVHDLACSVMDYECLALDQTSKENIVIPKGIRHLSLILDRSSSYLPPFIIDYFRKSQTIRTLLLLARNQLIIELNCSNFRNLRVLDVRCSSFPNIGGLLSSVAYLIHLRYLNLSGMDIKTLPESLSNLKHLQTLKLANCRILQKLPANMSSSLMHLDIRGCYSLSHMPSGLGQLIHLQTLCLFIVGKKGGCGGICELQRLNLIRGPLHIKGLENVKNSMDAKEANLIRKRNLDSLTLSWSWSRSPNIQEYGDDQEEVLEALQPPASIKTLTIERYQGMKFPSWIEDLSLLNLVSVKLIHCKRCDNVPPLGHLPCLKFIELNGMDSVRYLSFDVYSGDGLGKGFPLLERLYLAYMRNLEEILLVNVPEGRGEAVLLPCLMSLKIECCGKLKSLPLLVSLQELIFERCNSLITLPRLMSISPGLGELDQFSSLKEFRIERCNAMKCLWEEDTHFQLLSSLKELYIGRCKRLTSLSGMRYLTALEHLYIGNCRELHLSELEDFQHLTSLQELSIYSLPKLTSLPENIKHSTTLQRLEIVGCGGLTALPEWIHNLTSLQTIYLSGCPNLTFLPDGLKQMTTLQRLTIINCSTFLGTRCREGGEDWHKISHIAKVFVRSRS